jgi:hypothetical protein
MPDDQRGYLGKVPWCPPIVGLAGGAVAHLLCWEQIGGAWWAWVSWVQDTSDRPRHHVVQVRAEAVRQLEAPDAYRLVPRRVRGPDGQLRPWSP